MRYEWITSTYANTDNVQFMNYGYADLDQHGDDRTANYSTKLYEQVIYRKKRNYFYSTA